MREDAATKAKRLLGEGRLIVVAVDRRGVRATCRGEGAVHELGWRPSTGWICSCPVVTDQCSHLRALRHVVAVDLEVQR